MICSQCAKEKPDDSYRMCEVCRAYHKDQSAKWRVNNPKKKADIQRKYRYGISPEEWEKKFEEQGRCCASCKSQEPGGKGWQTDHNHQTGEIRGILCFSCNTALGQLKESIERIQQLLAYAIRWKL